MVLLHFPIFWLSLLTRLTHSSLDVSKHKQFWQILQYLYYLFQFLLSCRTQFFGDFGPYWRQRNL